MANEPIPKSGELRVLRESKGTCPVCIEMVPTRFVVEGGNVYVEKNCPKHGINRALISRQPEYFSELHDFYFSVMTDELPQRDYILRLTAKCNLDCPICLASANEFEEKDLSRQRLDSLLQGRKKIKLDLMGAEPTLRDDLEAIIRDAAAKGHITALHTNGIVIGNADYLGRLKAAGLAEVHLQCDGFNDEHDIIIRGKPMGKIKAAALDALEKHGLSTDLVMTVLRGLNEGETTKVLDYAASHSFVKEVFYLGCRLLGRASEGFDDRAYAPDELIDVLAEKTDGKIRRDDVLAFQKLYFSLLALFRVRKCFYIHHYMVLRSRSGWEPISEFMDLPYLGKKLEKFPQWLKKSRLGAGLGLFWHTGLSILRKGGFELIAEGLVLTAMLFFGFDLSKIRRRSILLGFITACDPWIHDSAVAIHCGKGEVAEDIGRHESGADANVAREKLHLNNN